MTAVIEQTIRTHLRGCQVVRNMHRRFPQAELVSGQQPYVANNDDSVLIDHDGLAPTKLLNRCRDFIDSLRRNLSGIASVGQNFLKRPDCNFHKRCSLPSSSPCLQRLARLGCSRASSVLRHDHFKTHLLTNVETLLFFSTHARGAPAHAPWPSLPLAGSIRGGLR